MLDLNIIYLKDLKAVLSYRDIRSIKSFLLKHKVEIFGSKGCKRLYVFKIQFERAQLQEKIQCLKNRYGKDWLNVFQTEMKIYAEHKALLEENGQKQKIFITPKKENKLTDKYVSKFLTELQSFLTEL
jgi:hypothetical protein